MQNQIDSLAGRAQAALQSGDLVLSEQLCRQLLSLDQTNFAGHLLLGSVLLRDGRKAEAVGHFRVVAESDPGRYSAQFALGRLLLELGRYAESRQALQRAISIRADDGNSQHCLAACLHGMGEFELAHQHYLLAVELAPESDEFHNDLGVIQTHLGMSEAAAASYRTAAKLNPERGKLLYHMASHHHFETDDEEFKLLQQQYEKSTGNTAKQVYLAFALGKAWSDVSEYEKAFNFYQEGNRAYRDTYEFSVEQEVDRFQRIRAHFGELAPLTDRTEQGCAVTPIFIMGMPRSGTTLTEQVLASHSRVKAIGESDFFGTFVRQEAQETGLSFPELLESCSSEKLQLLGRIYLDRYAGDLADGDYLIEKTTLNFYYVGFLKRLFPHAQFIHCTRDPLDTCWSIYTRYFVQGGHHYGYDLEDLGQYYQLHMAMVSFWKGRCPCAIHTVDYSRLTAEPEQSIKDLLDFCGLEFEMSCLSPHETQRGVRTASAAQVRQPIYQSTSRASDPYTQWLEPLREALNQSIEGLGDG